MRIRVLNWGPIQCGAILLGIAASLLAGCGGGGMGGYSMSMSPMPAMSTMSAMPTVKITSPAQPTTIKLGQGVTVAWSSTDSTSCTASASSAMAGAFSGSQAASGSVVVAPTASGNATYTVTCTGMDGTAMATSATVTVTGSILSTLSTASIVKIGPTLDPSTNKFGGNPYGLAIAQTTAGLITKGDLVVCNFNSGATGTQGSGTTVVGLHPPAAGAAPGAQLPYSIADDPALTGCSALAMLPDGGIAAAAFTAGKVPLVAPAGSVTDPFAADSFGAPWGVAFAPTVPQVMAGYGAMQMPMTGPAQMTGPANPTLYVSNVDGSIDRIELNGDAQSSFTKIATGFCGSGAPGAIFAPSGLTYDNSVDTLYIVDTSSNSVVAFANVSSIGAAGVVVNGQCASVAAPPTPTPTFSGPSATSARVIATGSPLIAPISAALLADGDLIVGNGDVNITATQVPNLVVEVSPVLPGGFVGAPLQLDAGTNGPGAACGASIACGQGALFGIAAAVDAQGNQLVYFNDDNGNAVMRITQ
jgi:hypothetical protein